MRRQKLVTGARDFLATITPRRRSRSAQPAARPSQYIHPSASSAIAIPQSLAPEPGSGPTPSASVAATPQPPAVIVRESFTPDPALSGAIEECIEKLSQDDKAAFRSAGDIMQKIQEMDEENSGDTSARTLRTRVGAVLQVIKRFTASVGPCVQYSPHVSLAIGGFNCVLLLVLGYIQFFEDLTSMIERIGEHLHYLTQYSSTVFRSSLLVQNALVSAWCDLLEFFVAAKGVFGDQTSYLKSFKLFMRVTWEPFESRFKPIEDKFLHHALIVIRSAGVEGSISRYNRLEQEGEAARVEKRRAVLAWLSPIDFEDIHQAHFEKHFENTGEWLLQHQDFATWNSTPGSSLLWCHGTPGTGKTVLASLVIEEQSSQHQLSKNIGISFVYFHHKEQLPAATYVGVIIKQLCRRMKELPVELEAFYDNHYLNASKPGCKELQGALIHVLKYFERVFLVLDALDECRDQRKELLEVLSKIVSPTTTDRGNVKLFITSRKERDIEFALKTFPRIEIEAKKVDKDIELYVTSQLQKHRRDGTLIIDDSLERRISAALTSQAGGMFLWVEFQLQHILDLPSYHDIEGALKNLPENIEETYERIIQLIQERPREQRELARRVLMWVAYATRPLELEELECAVAMETTTKSNDELESMRPRTELVLDVCRNLIVLSVDSPDGSSCAVRFVHFSVHEFLIDKSRNPESSSAVATLNIAPQVAHAEMSHMSINFLVFCQVERMDDCFEYSRLSNYAVSNWNRHAGALTGLSQELILSVLEFFKFGAFFEGPLWGEYNHAWDTRFLPSTTALIFSLPLLFSELRESIYDPEDYPDELYAMHYAARHDSHLAVKQLCDRGFSVEQLDNSASPAIFYARSKTVAELLLDKGFDINRAWEGSNSVNLLHAAVLIGVKEVVQLYLDRGANVNAQGGRYGNALQAAAFKGSVEVVQLLLDWKADVNAQGGRCGNALQAAAFKGSVEVVQLLLDWKADVNAQGGEYGNALQAAASSGSVEVVQLLLDWKADVNVQGGYYGNALQAAARRDSVKVVQLLLDCKADVNTQGGDHGNALQAAASGGSVEVVQLLLDWKADVNAQGGRYGNALQAAAFWSSGSVEVVQLLLDWKADVNAQGGEYGNALQAAVFGSSGSVEVVQLLLDWKADVNAQGGEYGNALQAAAFGSSGSVEVVQLLLDWKADVNAQGGRCGNALQAAAFAFEGSVEVVQLLLDWKADVNAQGGECGNALQAAAFAFEGSVEVVQLLLDWKADVNTQGGEYGNALQAAAHRGSVKVVQLLLDWKADVNAQGGRYGNALQAAVFASEGSVEVVQLLRKHGAVEQRTDTESLSRNDDSD